MIEKNKLPFIVLLLFLSMFKSSGTLPKLGKVSSGYLTLSKDGSLATFNVIFSPLYSIFILSPSSYLISLLLNDSIFVKSGK